MNHSDGSSSDVDESVGLGRIPILTMRSRVTALGIGLIFLGMVSSPRISTCLDLPDTWVAVLLVLVSTLILSTGMIRSGLSWGPRTKMVVGCLIAVGILGSTSMIMLLREEPFGPAPFPMNIAEKLSVDELADRLGEVGTLVLPTWMPGQVKLREIYLKGLAILVYSDKDVKDYRQDNVTIQLKKTRSSPTPAQIRQRTSGEVLQVGDFWIVLLKDAAPGPDMKERGIEPIMSYFWYDGFYYIITVNKGEITQEDLVSIIENMKPVGPETLRKP